MNFSKRNNAPQKPEPKTPAFHAYTVRDGKGENSKGFWTKMGAFFPHEDGEGGTLLLDALPLDGRIVLRSIKSDE